MSPHPDHAVCQPLIHTHATIYTLLSARPIPPHSARVCTAYLGETELRETGEQERKGLERREGGIS